MFGVHKGTDEYDIPRQHLNKVNLTLKNICQRDIQYWRRDYQIDWFTSTIVCQCGKSWILWVNNQTLNFYKSMWKISSHHMRVYKVSVHFCDLFFALLVLKKYYCVLKLNSPKVNFITIEKNKHLQHYFYGASTEMCRSVMWRKRYGLGLKLLFHFFLKIVAFNLIWKIESRKKNVYNSNSETFCRTIIFNKMQIYLSY